MLTSLKTVRKAVVAGIGTAVTVLTFVTHNFGGVLPGTWTTGIGILVAVLTTVATWAVPNDVVE